MKARIVGVLGSLLVVSLVLGAGAGVGLAEESEAETEEAVAAKEEKNMLINPGFEKCTPGEVKNQKVFAWSLPVGGKVELVTEEEKTHSGSQCLIFSPKGSVKDTHLWQQKDIQVKSGKKYILKVWARVDKEVLDKLSYTPRVKLVVYQRWFKSEPSMRGEDSNYLRPVTEQWKEFTYEWIAKEGADKAICGVIVTDCPVYIDDVSFSMKVEEADLF